MAQRAEYLQLETSDDVTSVRDRLSFMRGKRVLIIWPPEGTVLTRKLDLVLIQREAMRRSIRLALVTHDPEVIKHARELNISAFETVGASEKHRWKRGRTKVFPGRLRRDPEIEAAEAMTAPRPRARVEDDPDDRPRRGIITRLLALLAFGGVALGVAYVVVPTAQVTIAPVQERLPVTVTIVADPDATDIQIAESVIPAVTLRVEIEDTGTLPTTGSRDARQIPATGSVIFINQTNQLVDIPADTVVSTSAGTPILFRTTQPAAAPAEVGGQIEVPVEALPEFAGPVGNVEAGLINTIAGPLAEQLSVRNFSPTSGGSSEVESVVTSADYDRLQATLRQQLQSRAYLAMEAQRTETQTIILETIRIAEERDDWKTWSAQVGDAAPMLSLTMRARVEATVIDEALARQIALAALTAQIPPGRALVPETVAYTCCSVQTIDPEGRVTFTMTGEGLVSSQVDLDRLQQRLAGRPVSDAVRYLLAEVEMAEGAEPRIDLSPGWLDRLPILPMRITLEVAPSA